MRRQVILGALAATAAFGAVTAGSSTAGDHRPPAEHVLLLSVDGLHQSDLAWYVREHGSSALAGLVRRGVQFTQAVTPFPSDSFPGLDPTALDAGQGLPGLPDSILQMTGNPTTLLDTKQLPVDPATCKPVYPHQYIKVNTIFEVARQGCARPGPTSTRPTKSSTGRRGPASRICSRPRSTATRRRQDRATTGRATTR